MGDVLTLLEKTQQNYDQAKAKELERKCKKNECTIKDFAEQIKAIKKMGSLGDLIGMIPGLKKVAGRAKTSNRQPELSRIPTQKTRKASSSRANKPASKRRPHARKAPDSRSAPPVV